VRAFQSVAVSPASPQTVQVMEQNLLSAQWHAAIIELNSKHGLVQNLANKTNSHFFLLKPISQSV